MIELKNISKTYDGKHYANQDITFEITDNQVVGLLGKNGSGKTTLIRQLLQLVKPTSGEICGVDLTDTAYVPQIPVFFPALTVAETISLNMRYLGVGKEDRRKRTKTIIEEYGLGEYANRFAYQLSGGMKKMMLIASAFSTDKSFIILDEPTSMIDIKSKRTVWEAIRRNQKEKMILLASHDMEEVRTLCTRVVVLQNGAMCYDQSLLESAASAAVEVARGDLVEKKIFKSPEAALAYLSSIKSEDGIQVSYHYPASFEEAIDYV